MSIIQYILLSLCLLGSIASTGQGDTEIMAHGLKIPDVAPNSNTPVAGLIRFNTAMQDFEGYDGAVWKSLTGLPSPNTTPQHAIGDYAQGGVVFWVSPDAMQYKVVHIHELERTIWRNPFDVLILATSNSDGLSNSQKMVTGLNFINSAADECMALVVESYEDWYLPALDELYQLMSQASVINPTILSYLGDEVINNQYWSSTEDTDDSAMVVSSHVDPMIIQSIGKRFTNRVRAVRHFTIAN